MLSSNLLFVYLKICVILAINHLQIITFFVSVMLEINFLIQVEVFLGYCFDIFPLLTSTVSFWGYSTVNFT